jgi:acylphosphatase
VSGEVAVHVIVRGRVQGVGFRAFVEDEAMRRGLQGWVRNRRDGTVEALFAGAAEAVRVMIEACRNGPPGSRVEALDQRPANQSEHALGEGGGFAVLPTA